MARPRPCSFAIVAPMLVVSALVLVLAPVLAAAPAYAVQSTGNIADYLRRPGDQVVVVPDGTYHAAKVHAPHDRTNGRYRGWLVLQAQRRNGVVVDLEGSELRLDAATSRILFVGFRFVNGSITIDGHDIAFWYTDHSFPARTWAKQGPSGAPERGYYHSPDAVHAYAKTTRDVAFYGSDIHDTGDAVDISNSTRTTLAGVSIFRLSDQGVDPHDIVHPDAIDGVSGNSSGLTVRNSWLQGRVVLEDDGAGGGRGGRHRNVLFENDWVSNSPSAGFIFTAKKQGQPRGIFGKRVDVRSWGHNNGHDRIDIVDGRSSYTSNESPNRIDVVDSGIVKQPPGPGATSPAAKWRAAHAYASWPAFFDFPAPSSGSTPIVAELVAGLVIIGAVVAIVVLRRRRKRASPGAPRPPESRRTQRRDDDFAVRSER
jgi:hypothetical protein